MTHEERAAVLALVHALPRCEYGGGLFCFNHAMAKDETVQFRQLRCMSHATERASMLTYTRELRAVLALIGEHTGRGSDDPASERKAALAVVDRRRGGRL